MRRSRSWAALLLAPFMLLVACSNLAPQGQPAATPRAPAAATATLAATAVATTTSPPTATTPDPLPTAPATPEPTTPATAVPTPTSTKPIPTAAPSPAPTATPCMEAGTVEQGTIDSTTIAGPFAYRIYLPPCYGADGRTYPTLYLLPGNIHDDSIWDVLGIDEAADAAIASGDIQPLIIVMPDGGWIANETSGGPNSYEGLLLTELIPAIEQTTCADPRPEARAIGGLSRGGYWATEIAFRHPDLFRSVGGHSLALVDTHAGAELDPVQTGATNDLGDLRISLDLGDRDPYLVQARPLHEALMEAGVKHVWRITEGTHDNAYWEENIPSYLRWYDEGWAFGRDDLPTCATVPD